MDTKYKLNIILAQPRGFCAGVDRAVEIVEKAIKKFGTPIYVHHEIVHNKHIVNDFLNRGVIFVESIDEIPNDSVIILSAHGASEKVEVTAKAKSVHLIDATCPLVKKVHNESIRNENSGLQVIVVGHKNHPEVIGTAGRIKNDALIVEKIEDIDNLQIKDKEKLSYVTQTTLSLYDTKEIVDALIKKFPNIKGLGINDICYATTNRQKAVEELSKKVDLILVIGAENSSNSNRLKDLAIKNNVKSYLINDYQDLNFQWFKGIKSIGITAGASAPEFLVQELIKFISSFFDVNISTLGDLKENTIFKIPKELD